MGTVTKIASGDQHTTAHPSPFPRVLIHLIMWGLPLVVLVAVTTMSASTSVNSTPSNSEVVASEVSIPSNSSKPDLTQEVVALRMLLPTQTSTLRLILPIPPVLPITQVLPIQQTHPIPPQPLL